MFEKGNKHGKGRPVGTKNGRTLLKQDLLDILAAGWKGTTKLEALPARKNRLAALLTCSDMNVRYQTERFLAEQDWGKPKQSMKLEADEELGTLIREAAMRAKGHG